MDWRQIDPDLLAQERHLRETRGALVAANAPQMADETWVDLGGVPCLRLTPAILRSEGAVVYIHGGGWVFGSPAQTIGQCRHMAERSGRVVFAIRYPLAPENPWPAATEAAVKALIALSETGPVAALVGASAGAQIAAEAALRLRDQGCPLPEKMILFYGAFAMTAEGWSHQAYGHSPEDLTSAEMAAFIAAYQAPGAADITGADMTGLPPIWFCCGDRDTLLGDTLTVFRNAVTAGNRAHLDILPGRGHGFMSQWHCDDAARLAVGAAIDWLGQVQADRA